MKEKEKMESMKIEFTIKELKNGLINRNIMCWPVLGGTKLKSSSDSDIVVVLQVNGYKTYSYKAIDGTLLNILSKIISGTMDSLMVQKNSQVAVQRSFDILDIFKTLLSERNHALLFYHMTAMFPKLFNFRESGVLFMDVKSKHLYSITSDDYEKTAIDLNEDNIVRYPNNIGLTGLAIKNKEILIAH